MKKLVNTPISNTIWWATVDEKKGMITGNKQDVTDNAIEAVLNHLMWMKEYGEDGWSGYNYTLKDENSSVCICAYDTNKYKITPITNNSEEVQNG